MCAVFLCLVSLLDTTAFREKVPLPSGQNLRRVNLLSERGEIKGGKVTRVWGRVTAGVAHEKPKLSRRRLRRTEKYKTVFFLP